MARRCACNCGASLVGMRADALYASEACKKRAQRTASRDKAGTEHPLREVRGEQEEGASADYLILAREQICRTLLATSFFTADDLEPLGIPQEYRRSVHGSATGYFSGEQPYMEEVGRRKSERPERKGGKNTIFRITVRGRRELPGLLRGMAGPVEDARKRLYGAELTAGVDVGHGAASPPAADSTTVAGIHPGGPQRLTGAPSPKGSDRSTNPPVPSTSATNSPAVESPPKLAVGENLSLLPEIDPEVRAA